MIKNERRFYEVLHGTLFNEWDRGYAKQIQKCNRLSDYEQITKEIFKKGSYNLL